MGSLAADLDIGRTTLYRWVGEREELLDEVLGGLVDEWFALVEPEARGEGRDRVLDVVRRFLEYAAAFPPLSGFAEREPALALRLLLDRDGLVVERSQGAVREVLDRCEPGLEVPDRFIEAIDLTSVGLVWANIAIGRPPDIDGAVDLTETLLGSCAALAD
jgi:AcrR family transcriptional regulator